MIHFREGTGADRDAILELRRLAFRDEDIEKPHADFWEWQFVDGYAGPGRFFVAESADTIVGHFAFVPQTYAARGEDIRGALACDVMTHPDFRRQRVFSRLAAFAADRLKDDFRIITAFQIREQVLPGMVSGGWTAATETEVLLKPLSLRGIARDLGLPFGAAIRDTPPDRIASIRPLTPRDLDQVDAFLSTDAVRQPRTAEFLSWRYGRNPYWSYQQDGFFEGEKLLAFVVHRETELKGLRTLAIAEAGGDARHLRPMIMHACKHGRQRNLAVAASLMSREHPAYRALRRSGFFPGPHRFRLLLQVFDERLRWMHQAPWSLSWGDTDHL